ncbi:unnamed protein product [Lupinus luteus]|uniref:Uncharacterized protein n=1 Tax=Lupinus luteus TaxID=3873 RepID=A0AAV1X6F1_LUPLU
MKPDSKLLAQSSHILRDIELRRLYVAQGDEDSKLGFLLYEFILSEFYAILKIYSKNTYDDSLSTPPLTYLPPIHPKPISARHHQQYQLPIDLSATKTDLPAAITDHIRLLPITTPNSAARPTRIEPHPMLR